MPIRAVLFDAAGTLIRTAEPVGEVYARAFAAQGVELPAWRIEDAFRRVLRRADPCVFPEAPDEEVPELERRWWWWRVRETLRATDSQAQVRDFDAVFAELWSHFARPDSWVALDGAEAVLDALGARGLGLALVSNFDARLDRILEGLGLAAKLQAVVRPAHARAAKPDARIFRAALERLGVVAEEAVHVGDDPDEDLAGARAAGLGVIDVRELATLGELPSRLAALE